jgi:peptide/nickel transport system substrate-binding protein
LAFWKIPLDPDQYFFWHSTQKDTNITNYKNVKIDKLLEDGRSSIFPSDRKKYYIEFQKIIAEDIPAIFLYYPYTYTIERK